MKELEPGLERARPVITYLREREEGILERRREEWERIRRSEILLVVGKDEGTKKRGNYPALWPLEKGKPPRPGDARVDGRGIIYLPRWQRRNLDYMKAHGEEFALLYPRGRLPRWERLGQVKWGAYSGKRVVSQLTNPSVPSGIETAIRYCGHVTGSRELGQMVAVLEEASDLMMAAIRKPGLSADDLQKIAEQTAHFLVESGLDTARSPDKQRIARKLLESAGFFTDEGKKNPFGVLMKLFSARLTAQKRIEGVIAGARLKYGANAEVLRFVRERTRGLVENIAERRIPGLLSRFSVFAGEEVVYLSPEAAAAQEKKFAAQRRAIVDQLATWAFELRQAVRVRPYIGPAWLVAGLIGGPFEGADLERAGLILGEEGLKEVQESRLLPLLKKGKYPEVRQGLERCQTILRQVLEEHKDIHGQNH